MARELGKAAGPSTSSESGSVEPVHLQHRAPLVTSWGWQAFAWALAAGALSALAAALIRLSFRGLEWLFTGSSADMPVAAAGLRDGRRLVTPMFGAGCAMLVLWLRDRWREHTHQPSADHVEYVAAVRHRGGQIPLEPNLWRTLSAAFSVATGAAVGREGSMIQFASMVTSVCGRRWRVPARGEALPFFVACGVAGGFTAAYNAPCAAAFAAAEIVLGSLNWQELPLLLTASGAGWAVSAVLLGPARLYPAPVRLEPAWALAWLPVLALVAALLGPVYQWLLGSLAAARRLPWALLWSGLVVGSLSVADPRVWGNADEALRAALGLTAGAAAPTAHEVAHVLLLRLAATAACVWTGTVGGVFTPTVFAGGALGMLSAHLLPSALAGESARLWAIAGMSCFLAAVTHAPVMAALMAVELTGNWQLLPLLLALNLFSSWIATRLSPKAMYSIASEAPASGRG